MNPLGSKDIPSGSTNGVSPWGSPPTPLLPRWYRDNIPNVRVSKTIRSGNPAVTKVGDLSTFWNGRSRPIDGPIRRSLLYIARTYPPPSSLVVIPAEIDRADLLGSLSVRATNALVRGGFLHLPYPLSVEDLLAIPNFGLTSLLELMCVAEATGLVRPVVTAPPVVTEVPSPPSDPRHERAAWDELTDLLELLLVAAGEFHGAISVSDALHLNLAELASDLGIFQKIDSYRIHDLTNVRILPAVIEAIRSLRETMPSRKIAILEQYLFARRRTTLEELGSTFGVTRERIRQVKNRVATEMEELVGEETAILAAVLKRRAGPLVRQDDLSSLVDALFEHEPINDPAVDLTRRIVETSLEYDCVRGVCANSVAKKILDRFRKQAVELADDVGLIDEEALRATLPDDRWRRLFELSVERSSLVRIGDGLALRVTKKARAKTAILSIGRLATLDEIVAESGLPRTNLGGLLSEIPGVARASKTKWGMEDWIEDEYEGIAAEIEQRIEEDGGATPLARLIKELPTMFEVKEASVRTLVATPQFVVSDGKVRLAKESEVTLRDLYEVVDGVTDEGCPYWSFRVHGRYFDGYSLAGVPPEIAHALGCPKNGGMKAVVSKPSGCRRVSVNWRLTSVSGATVGYISTALNRLGVAEGDRVCLVVVRTGVVEFRRFDPKSRRENGEEAEQRVDGAATATGVGSSALLERLKRRRRVL